MPYTKYYYLKLRANYFEHSEIKLIQANKNGSVYNIILLKLLLKGEYYDSGYRFIEIKQLGIKVEDYLSIILDENSTDIKEGIKLFEQYKLFETIENIITIRDLNVDLSRNRGNVRYKQWRNAIFERDNYTCMRCNKRGYKLNAHHIKEWSKYFEHRFDVNNGITLCVDCHKMMHKKRT